jgi:hypothetical protein
MEGRDRSAARTTLGREFPTRALSIGEVGASLSHGPRFRRPPCDPGPWAFPRPVLTWAPRRSPSRTARGLRADSHPPLRRMVCFHGRSLVRRPTRSGDSWSGHVPRVPVHAQGVTSCVMVSRPLSVGVPPRALLVRTPAPVLHPPRVSVLPSTPGLCRWRSAPAGSRTFPTFSLRLCPGVLGPLPRRLVRCPGPLLPSRPRPSPRADRVGAPPWTVQRLPYGALCRGCSHALLCRPAGVLATPIAPPDTVSTVWQP